MKNGKLIRNYIYNTLYQILVLIAPLITTPYVSRVLGVTNIAVYNYAQSIATYFVLAGAVGTSLYGQREISRLRERRLFGRSKYSGLQQFCCVQSSIRLFFVPLAHIRSSIGFFR